MEGTPSRSIEAVCHGPSPAISFTASPVDNLPRISSISALAMSEGSMNCCSTAVVSKAVVARLRSYCGATRLADPGRGNLSAAVLSPTLSYRGLFPSFTVMNIAHPSCLPA